MGCAPSGNHKSKSGGAMKEVKFENMKMQDVDSYFESIQEILNLFIKFSEPLNEAKTNLFERTGFNKEKNPSNSFSLTYTRDERCPHRDAIILPCLSQCKICYLFL